MPHKFRVTLEYYDEVAKKILNKWQYLIYKAQLMSLVTIIHNRIKKYALINRGGIKVYEETSDDLAYLKRELHKFDKFMYSDAAKLQESHQDMAQHLNDRVIRQLRLKSRKYLDQVKTKLVNKVLGTDDVYTFFVSIGILLKWELIEEKDLNSTAPKITEGVHLMDGEEVRQL